MQDFKSAHGSQKNSSTEEMPGRLKSVQLELNRISPSFCAAKWKQVTLHLQNGLNHSCHHPDTHKADVRELKANPSALHNTKFKKEQREQMLNGQRPSECSYCWKAEDAPGGHFSDRIIKSADDWAYPFIDSIAKSPSSQDVNPSYVEVSFGSECNFRCTYCRPDISSSVWRSYEIHGPYVGMTTIESVKAQGGAPIKAGEQNPYIDAFWAWLPKLSKELQVLRVTGGEPLINPNTTRLIDFLCENPAPHMSLAINSNFGVAERFFEHFLRATKRLHKGVNVKDFQAFTSVDTHGAHAEFLRVGLKYDLWKSRVRSFLRETPWNLTFMVTFNALSVPRFLDLLKDILQINQEHLTFNEHGQKTKRTLLDTSYMANPEHTSLAILTPEWIDKIGEIVNFMTENSAEKIGPAGFLEYEIHKLKRIEAIAKSHSVSNDHLKQTRALFAKFIEQYEEREKKCFTEIFPEMRDFMSECQSGGIGQQVKIVDERLDTYPKLAGETLIFDKAQSHLVLFQPDTGVGFKIDGFAALFCSRLDGSLKLREAIDDFATNEGARIPALKLEIGRLIERLEKDELLVFNETPQT